MAAHQASPSLRFSRQEHWRGLPFPSPMHESEKRKWSHSVVSNSQQLHGLQPTRLLRPWDFHSSLEKCKSKPWWDTTSQWEWQESKWQQALGRIWRNWQPHTLLVGIKWCNHFGNSLPVLQKVKHTVIIWTSNSTSGCIPKRTGDIKTCTWMFPAALFITTEKQKQPTCASTGEWINEMWWILEWDIYSFRKMSKVLIHATTWISIVNTKWKSQTHTKNLHIVWFSLNEMSRIG